MIFCSLSHIRINLTELNKFRANWDLDARQHDVIFNELPQKQKKTDKIIDDFPVLYGTGFHLFQMKPEYHENTNTKFSHICFRNETVIRIRGTHSMRKPNKTVSWPTQNNNTAKLISGGKCFENEQNSSQKINRVKCVFLFVFSHVCIVVRWFIFHFSIFNFTKTHDGRKK